MIAEELLVLNPLLYDDLEKYIWIDDSYEAHCNAQILFHYLLQKHIYINGFASRTAYLIGLKLYNKRIYDYDMLEQENTVVFYDTYFKYTTASMVNKGVKVRSLNPNIIGDKIVIWGAGRTGKNAFKILRESNINIECFVDTNRSLWEMEVDGVPVYAPEKLNQFTDNIVIVEALEKWKQVEEQIKAHYHKRFYHVLDSVWNFLTYEMDGIERKVCNLANFWSYNRFANRKVYIYGDSDIEKAFADYLRMMDYDFEGLLVDERNFLGKESNGYPMLYVEEVLYDNDFYIWVFEKKNAGKLRELGLKYFRDYECKDSLVDIAIGRIEQLDVNLVTNYFIENPDDKYPGIRVYGRENEKDYKIAVIGASTTDGAVYSFKSWPEIFFEEIEEEGITLYNGGTGDYSSGQELLKLIRDILSLEPDMIIVYDGFNDMTINAEHPFGWGYLNDVFSYVRSHMEDNDVFECSENICLGIPYEGNSFDNWLSNIRSMHAIANEWDIKFFSFCSPDLSSKQGRTLQEKNILLSASSDYMMQYMKKPFREYIREKTDLPDYIYDLSHIFDWETDVYMDICHVWEKGNRIIAKEIAKVVLPEVRKARMEKE